MKTSPIAVATLALAAVAQAASPVDDLASPSQKTRDAAAESLRASYRAPPRPTLAAFKKGDAKKAVLQQLPPGGARKGEGGVAGGGSYSESYRLDDLWVLTCWWVNRADTLIEHSLDEQLRYVWVEPPPRFTGTWTIYFVNGQRHSEIEYRDGKYLGRFTSFHAGGTKSVVQIYGAQGIDGEELGYFPSGKVSYRAFHKQGKPVGTWLWYDEKGAVREKKEHGSQLR